MATKKKSTVKRRVSGTKTKASVGRKKRKVSGTSSIGKIGTARNIMGKIDKLEKQRKAEKRREMKDIIQLEINQLHDKIDALKKTYKKL
jgi:hypothetical protein